RRHPRNPVRNHRQPDLALPGKSSCRTRWKESGLSPVMRCEMNVFDEERIGRLLRLLPPAPEGWVRAAQELPAARSMLDELVARATAAAVVQMAARLAPESWPDAAGIAAQAESLRERAAQLVDEDAEAYRRALEARAAADATKRPEQRDWSLGRVTAAAAEPP